MKLFISPHCDDEALFGAFTILRERPLVVIVFDSYVQQNRGASFTASDRRAETLEALTILGHPEVHFLGFRDDQPDWGAITMALHDLGAFEATYAPAFEEGGHPQHNGVAAAAKEACNNVVSYMTYTNRGKSIGAPVAFESEWPALKLQALSCYRTQIAREDNRDHFLREQMEYYQA